MNLYELEIIDHYNWIYVALDFYNLLILFDNGLKNRNSCYEYSTHIFIDLNLFSLQVFAHCGKIYRSDEGKYKELRGKLVSFIQCQ